MTMKTHKLMVLAVAAAVALPGVALAAKSVRIDGRFEDIGERYARQVLAVPADRNPILDTTGEHCGEGRIGDVPFLAGSPVGQAVVRECTIRPDTVVVIPVKACVHIVRGQEGAPIDRDTRKALRRMEMCVRTARMRVTVDGRRLPRSKIYYTGESERNGSPLFAAELPRLGPVAMVERGHFAAIRGFGEGQHTISWEAEGCGALDLDAENVEYTLTVVD
jgi:hypothetical protein